MDDLMARTDTDDVRRAVLAAGMTCAAYPDGIPITIASGEVDHLVVRPGQVGDTIFEVVENPTGLAQRFLANAASRGEKWALEALAKAEAAGPAAWQEGT